MPKIFVEGIAKKRRGEQMTLTNSTKLSTMARDQKTKRALNMRFIGCNNYILQENVRTIITTTTIGRKPVSSPTRSLRTGTDARIKLLAEIQNPFVSKAMKVKTERQ